MPERIEITPSQRRQCNRLIKRLCANYDDGNCPTAGRRRALCLPADHLLFTTVPVFPECGFTSRKGTVCGYFQTAYLSLRRVRSGFCAELQPAEILPVVQQKGAPQAEKRERKKAQSGQLGV